jgi:hypothetical protein
MTLVAGGTLDPKRYFGNGCDPLQQGSSFDLTIGGIYDSKGQKVAGPFTLKAGHMVQVASAQVFNLPDHITGHVTYKTTLTLKGIWALTVGIVDPGWDAPISTTLLNFSKIDHVISEGDPFLRVSFFEHAPVPSERLRKAPPLEEYLKNVQRAAASIFPETFLDNKEIARRAGVTATTRMRNQAVLWVGAMALVFALIQILASYLNPAYILAPNDVSRQELSELKSELATITARLRELGQTAVPPREEVAPPTEDQAPATEPEAPQTGRPPKEN